MMDMTALLAKLKAFSERDVVSSIGHALLACGVVVLVRWVSQESASATWWAAGLTVGAYLGREIGDAVRFAREKGAGTIGAKHFARKLADGWLDLMFPLVATSVLAAILTGGIS